MARITRIKTKKGEEDVAHNGNEQHFLSLSVLSVPSVVRFSAVSSGEQGALGRVTMNMRLLLLVCLADMVLTSPGAGQPKPDPKKAPQIIVMTPLGAAVGSTTKVTLRGLRLDTVSEVRCREPGVGIKVLSKGKVGVPNQMDPNKLGDTQVEVEIKIPATSRAMPPASWRSRRRENRRRTGCSWTGPGAGREGAKQQLSPGSIDRGSPGC